MHVILAGGGTAGHVEPALATADALRRLDPTIGITALGTASGLEARLVPARGYELAEIPRVPLPRRVTPQIVSVPGRLIGAIHAVEEVIERTSASVVVGFGGYVAMPAYLAARRRHIPIVVHEANARPGLANRIGARMTKVVAVSFPSTLLPHAVHVGIPLRESVARLDRAESRAAARAGFGLDPQRPTLLVTGGSQGARRINDAVVGAAAQLAAAGVQVLHHTGAGNVDDVRAALADHGVPYVVLGYVDHMELAYAAADLVLCRAGAMTCAELAAVGLPAVYVPLPHGNGEQRLNATPTVDAGGGLIIADSDLDAAAVRDTVLPLIVDPDRLQAMGSAAATLGRRDADVTLAQMVIDTAERWM
ncbi:undecaprenyldiphospho-muramoylpentapeptide beta-N-acetylglucosaminyltransferase [Acidothermaceae bacterium B102]|nr:undecaprenyldiphospho-muramoylpentapeptide beta-N-acetylglucosaminyltransferase [Acidothermaceae bacterium B102]